MLLIRDPTNQAVIHQIARTDVFSVNNQLFRRLTGGFYPDFVGQVQAQVDTAEVAGVWALGDVVFALFNFCCSPEPKGKKLGFFAVRSNSAAPHLTLHLKEGTVFLSKTAAS